MADFSPREIVSELDRFIVGQHEAKRAVAIALRNRWRRQQLPEALREEILPKNILMIGPTGVGKTEIARRLARLAQAPFLKVEATKFTEVGYVGRDVEQIIRDLLEIGITMTRERLRKEVASKADIRAEERVINALVGENASGETRQKFRKLLREGKLDDKEIDLQVADTSALSFGNGTTDTPLTIEMWIQPTAMTVHQLLGKWGESTNQEYRFQVGAGTLRLDLHDQNAGVTTSVFTQATYSGIVGSWHHVAVTYDGRGGASAGNGVAIYQIGRASCRERV